MNLVQVAYICYSILSCKNMRKVDIMALINYTMKLNGINLAYISKPGLSV